MDQIIRKNKELGAILEVSRVLTSSFDLEKNFNAAMRILANDLEMQRGCVFLMDPLTKDIGIVAACGLSREEIERGTYRIGEGIVGKVIQTRSAMFIPNIGNEPKFLNRTGSRPEKKGVSFLCLPIALEDEILGVISVDRIYNEKHGNVDDDLRVLHIVSSLIAQFVKLWGHYTRTEKECGLLRSQLKEKYSLPNIIGESTQIQQVLKSIKKVAATDTTVLLLGESGTGKELMAQTLHYQSRRSKHPFIAVNLAALPENLIEVELFGVEKGAFTGATARRIGRFETANKGTLFLDEIGELPLSIQVKILRVLQERSFERIGSSTSIQVDTRVVAATNRNLLEEVRMGNFREDLYWRLNVVPIVLPPLRKRTSDIPLLISYYLDKFNRNYRRKIRFHKDVGSKFVRYPWPGNVRELANTIERLVIMAEKNEITPDDLPRNIDSGLSDLNPEALNRFSSDASLNYEVQALERQRIISALRSHKYIQQKASEALGITPRQLGYKIKKYSINLKSL